MADDDHEHLTEPEQVPSDVIPVQQEGSKVGLAGLPLIFEVEKIEDPNLGRIIVHVYHTPLAVFRFAMREEMSKMAVAELQQVHGTPKLQIAREIPPNGSHRP